MNFKYVIPIVITLSATPINADDDALTEDINNFQERVANALIEHASFSKGFNVIANYLVGRDCNSPLLDSEATYEELAQCLETLRTIDMQAIGILSEDLSALEARLDG